MYNLFNGYIIPTLATGLSAMIMHSSCDKTITGTNPTNSKEKERNIKLSYVVMTHRDAGGCVGFLN